MKRYLLTAMISVGLVIGTVPADAEQNRGRNPDLNGEIRIGVVLGEELLMRREANERLSSFLGGYIPLKIFF